MIVVIFQTNDIMMMSPLCFGIGLEILEIGSRVIKLNQFRRGFFNSPGRLNNLINSKTTY